MTEPKNAHDMSPEEFKEAVRVARGLSPKRWSNRDRPAPPAPIPSQHARNMTPAEFSAAKRQAIRNDLTGRLRRK